MIDIVDPVRCEIEVPISISEAFKLFTEGFNSWWPSDYTWSQESLESISLASCENGRCTEVGPNGFQVDWGRVLKCHPSEKIIFTWQISPNREPQPNPQKASVVEVNFTMINLKTTIVSLVHSGFEKHGEGALAYRESLNSDYGWPFILNKYLEVAKA